jgi:hypothetical protein
VTNFHVRLRTFGQELRRRRVLRVARIYAAAGWVAVESSDTIAPLLLLPDKRNGGAGETVSSAGHPALTFPPPV